MIDHTTKILIPFGYGILETYLINDDKYGLQRYMNIINKLYVCTYEYNGCESNFLVICKERLILILICIMCERIWNWDDGGGVSGCRINRDLEVLYDTFMENH